MPTFIPAPGERHELDLRDLSDHPLLASIPTWDRESVEFQALVESIRDHGLDYELLVDTEFRIVDGRNRRAALAVLGRRAPCRFVAKADAASVVVASLVNRRNLTKGALAYLVSPMFDEVIAESKARRTRNVLRDPAARKSGAAFADSPLSGLSTKTAAELADQMGLGRALFMQAMQLRRMFAKAGAEARASYEPRVLGPWRDEAGQWHEPVGLGYMINGLTSLIDGKAEEQLDKRQEHDRLFTSNLAKLSLHWDQASPAQREHIRADLKKNLLAFPAELVSELAEIARRTASEQRRISGAAA